MPVKYLYISCRFPRIYETTHVAYTRPHTSHIRDLAPLIDPSGNASGSVFCIGGVSFYIELRYVLVRLMRLRFVLMVVQNGFQKVPGKQCVIKHIASPVCFSIT